MAKDRSLILFVVNNAGKSNILSILDRLLDERFPTYIALEESDYYMEDRANIHGLILALNLIIRI